MDTGNRFHFALGFLDAGRRVFPKIGFQRDDMWVEFALGSVVVEFFHAKRLQATLLVEFKILAQGIFGDTDEFRDLRMGQAVCFQP